jgi:hypothetical protein
MTTQAVKIQRTFHSFDAAFNWYRSLRTKEEVIVTVAGKHLKFFRDSRGLIDSTLIEGDVIPRMVECLDCGTLVPWAEPCPNCGLGDV